jgi:hypothetical protein
VPGTGSGWAAEDREARRGLRRRQSAASFEFQVLGEVAGALRFAEPPQAAECGDLLLELGSVEALVSGDAAVEHLQ